MSYFEQAENVKSYIEMCKDYDGQDLISRLQPHLKSGAALLELGSGPGNDIELLQQHYQVTASDYSSEFVKHLKQRFERLNVLNCDANNLPTKQKYDCIYSNKVLHHLTPDELAKSLTQQFSLLNEGGILAHSFWMGAENFEMEGEIHYYHQKEALKAMLEQALPSLKYLEFYLYEEFEANDSAFVVVKKAK